MTHHKKRMSYSFVGSGGHIMCELSVEQIQGNGRPEWPLLHIQLRLVLRGPQVDNHAYRFQSLSCRLSPFDSTYLAESRLAYIDECMPAGEVHARHSAYVEIPLSQERIATIEKLRKSGDVKIRLDFELRYETVVQIATTKNSFNQVERIWGHKSSTSAHQQVHFEIPRSSWVERTLPALGYGKIHLIELPVMELEASEELNVSFKSLQEAQEHHKHGFYKAAIVSCRQAIEGILKAKAKGRDGNMIPVLDEKWRVRLGQGTYDWLNDAFGALKRPANEVAHGSERKFDQFDSLMIQTLTATLLAYAARSIANES